MSLPGGKKENCSGETVICDLALLMAFTIPALREPDKAWARGVQVRVFRVSEA